MGRNGKGWRQIWGDINKEGEEGKKFVQVRQAGYVCARNRAQASGAM